MTECVYCKRPMKEEAVVCIYCGYDHKLGTISQAYKPQQDAPGKESGVKIRIKEEKSPAGSGGVNPKVKKFAFIGILLVAFSILYKYNFNLSVIVSDLTEAAVNIKGVKFLQDKFGKKKARAIEKIELSNVEKFEVKKEGPAKKLRLEGIFFDPRGKSFATINGQVVSEGESVDNVILKKIDRNSVEVIAGNETKTLEVNQSISLP